MVKRADLEDDELFADTVRFTIPEPVVDVAEVIVTHELWLLASQVHA